MFPLYMQEDEKDFAFYRNAFEFSKKGYASAIAVFLFVIIMLLTLLQMRLQKKWVVYDLIGYLTVLGI